MQENQEVTPANSNVRTLVHEYGGRGHLLVDLPEGGVIYSNYEDQRLYWVLADQSVVDLLPTAAYEKDGQYLFADFVLDAARRRVICVREDRSETGAEKIVNTICAVALDGSGVMQVLVEGSDFYAAPRLSPDGKRLAYYCWSHPNMPWDATELFVAHVDAHSGAIQGEPTSVCGGADAQISVLQPAWSPQGELHFISDQTGWYNLYRYIEGYEPKNANLTPFDREYSGDWLGWYLGHQNYCFVGKGRVAVSYKRPDNGASRMVLIDPTTTYEFGQECLPRTAWSPCSSPDGTVLYFMGGDPHAATGIFEWRVPHLQVGSDVFPAKKIVSSMKNKIEREYISSPQLVSFDTGVDGSEKAHAYYYPPTNPMYTAPGDSKPPLLVQAHGGPTGCTSGEFNPLIQFWTSRGFAVLDVDYRGSTGYGRAYTQRMKGEFGVVDVEDVCAGAEFMVASGLADPTQLAVEGGSSGGLTVLAALTFKKVFSAGCSVCGIGDLKTLAEGSNKLESHYCDSLITPSSDKEKFEEVCNERSPIKHLDQLACPILLLHGTDDTCVPPAQSEMMYESVKSKGLPCALKMYPGEGHGFVKSENIQDALLVQLGFFSRVFGFEAKGAASVEVANLAKRAQAGDQ